MLGEVLLGEQRTWNGSVGGGVVALPEDLFPLDATRAKEEKFPALAFVKGEGERGDGVN